MKTVTTETTLYTFDELEQDAQQKALENWERMQWDDFSYYLEHFTDADNWPAVLEAIGFTVNSRPVQTLGGKTRYEPTFHYNFGWGPEFVSFDGGWDAAHFDPAAVEALKQDRPTDTRLHAILDDAHSCWTVASSGDHYLVKDETDRRSWAVKLVCRAQDDDGNDIPSDDVSDMILSLCFSLDSWMTLQVNEEMKYQTGAEALAEWAQSQSEEGDGCIFTEDGETN